MQIPTKIEVQGIRVLTTRQLANAYETTLSSINNNFARNKKRYIIGKHYIPIEGDELKQLRSSHQIDGEFKGVPKAYLWTEKGALLHAKSLNTDKAWEVYDYLVDFYFRAKEEVLLPDSHRTEVVPIAQTYSPLPEGTISNPIGTLEVLLSFARENKLTVKSKSFQAYYSRLKGNRIGVAMNLTVERVCYEVAYELAHAMLHSDAGDIVNSRHQEEYNLRAHNAALMLLNLIEHSAKFL